MSLDTYHLLTDKICFQYPLTPVHCHSDATVASNSLLLDHKAIFLSTLLSMASDIMCLRQLVGTSLHLSGSSSWAPLKSLPTENCLKSSSSVKTLNKQSVHCGWRGCAGSHHGKASAIVSRTICELPSSNNLLKCDSEGALVSQGLKGTAEEEIILYLMY